MTESRLFGIRKAGTHSSVLIPPTILKQHYFWPQRLQMLTDLLTDRSFSGKPACQSRRVILQYAKELPSCQNENIFQIQTKGALSKNKWWGSRWRFGCQDSEPSETASSCRNGARLSHQELDQWLVTSTRPRTEILRGAPTGWRNIGDQWETSRWKTVSIRCTKAIIRLGNSENPHWKEATQRCDLRTNGKKHRVTRSDPEAISKIFSNQWYVSWHATTVTSYLIIVNKDCKEVCEDIIIAHALFHWKWSSLVLTVGLDEKEMKDPNQAPALNTHSTVN